MSNSHNDLLLLRETVAAAGELALTGFRQDIASWHKADGSGLVTEMDLKVDEFLRERLLAARPDYGWLSEESADDPHRLKCERVFVVDPIDGTQFYANGQPDFGISVAVVADGEPETAVVHIPARDECYVASRGAGTFLNGRTLRSSSHSSLDGAKVLVRKSMLKANKWRDETPNLHPQPLVPLAYRFCKVAANHADATLTLWRAWEWDIAAGDLIAREAGFRTSDSAGGPLRYNSAEPRVDGVIVAPPKLHAEILARLSPRPAPGGGS